MKMWQPTINLIFDMNKKRLDKFSSTMTTKIWTENRRTAKTFKHKQEKGKQGYNTFLSTTMTVKKQKKFDPFEVAQNCSWCVVLRGFWVVRRQNILPSFMHPPYICLPLLKICCAFIMICFSILFNGPGHKMSHITKLKNLSKVITYKVFIPFYFCLVVASSHIFGFFVCIKSVVVVVIVMDGDFY